MSLQAELDAFREGWQDRVGPARAAQVAGALERMREAGMLDAVIAPGARIADPGTLRDAGGRSARLAPLLARPAILTLYRGGWCPYCILELRAWQAAWPRIGARGARLLALSPEPPEAARRTVEWNALTFPVLSDPDCRLAAALGLGGCPPLPATIVTGPRGVVASVFADPDYRRRAEPEAVLAALQAG